MLRQYDFSHWKHLPSVSCQCITYGRTKLLDEAVECFLRQDWPGKKELIILNDCKKMKIKSSYNSSEIKIINSPMRYDSVGAKRNKCVHLCSGEIIFPWDDDDICMPWRISHTISNMKNKHYYKPDKIWYWKNGSIDIKPKKSIAHAMGAYSKEFFNNVGGYPEIGSGQDQELEEKFKGQYRVIDNIKPCDIYYIYRFPGTGSYHLSSFGWNRGQNEVGKYVNKINLPLLYNIQPNWKQDYTKMINACINSLKE
jgi:hypothetical protein